MKNYNKLKATILANHKFDIETIKVDRLGYYETKARFKKRIAKARKVINQRMKSLLADLEYRKTMSEKFEKASPEMRRVMIAHDVIAQYRLKKFIPETGNFVKLKSDMNYTVSLQENDSLQSLCSIGKVDKCKTCEVGGAFMSIIRLNGDFKYEAGDELSMDRLKFRKTLNKYYSQNDIILMELAFEGGKGFYRPKGCLSGGIDAKIKYISNAELQQVRFTPDEVINGHPKIAVDEKMRTSIINALKFYRRLKHKSDIEKRFIGIQNSIIKNKGKKIF